MPPTDIWVLLVLVSSVSSLCVTVLYWLSMTGRGEVEVHTLLAGLTLGNTSDGGQYSFVKHETQIQFQEFNFHSSSSSILSTEFVFIRLFP